MSNNTDHAGNTKADSFYDEENDVYSTPSDAERLAYVEGQVKVLLRMVTAANYPNQRNTGGAVDSQIAMGGK